MTFMEFKVALRNYEECHPTTNASGDRVMKAEELYPATRAGRSGTSPLSASPEERTAEDGARTADQLRMTRTTAERRRARQMSRAMIGRETP